MESSFHRSSLLTCDTGVGEDTLKRIYPHVRLAVPREAAFELELTTATTPVFSAHQLRLQGASSTTVADLTGTLLIGQVLDGDLRLSTGREQVPTNGPFLLPQAPVTSRWEGHSPWRPSPWIPTPWRTTPTNWPAPRHSVCDSTATTRSVLRLPGSGRAR